MQPILGQKLIDTFAPQRYAQPTLNGPPLVTWRGVSNTTYQFHLHVIGTAYRAVPGVYIFCREALPGQWAPIYVGEGGDLDERVGSNLACHHKWPSVILEGATHICSLVVGGDRSNRLAVEKDLIHFYRPPLNDQ